MRGVNVGRQSPGAKVVRSVTKERPTGCIEAAKGGGAAAEGVDVERPPPRVKGATGVDVERSPPHAEAAIGVDEERPTQPAEDAIGDNVTDGRAPSTDRRCMCETGST
mgnify:CR=1 FL=1